MDKKDLKEKKSEEVEEVDNSELAEKITEKVEPKGEEAEDKVEQLENKVKSAEEQVKRYLADYQNLQRRVQEEKYQWIRSANKELLLKLLPVFDTLMLAQKHIQDKGLQLSIDQFLKALEAEGVKRIIAVGEKFNPHEMEAIGTGEGEKDKVVEEVRTGFTLYDSVLRTAQVIVGK
jgi:molecular chaperone GrpE